MEVIQRFKGAEIKIQDKYFPIPDALLTALRFV